MAAQVLNGEQTFLDQNGAPLSGGLVFMYAPNTSNFQSTWQDVGLSILNTNPIVLDQAGRAKIWGNVDYRQVVTDQFGNVQWDTITQAGISGSVAGNLEVTGNLTADGSLQVNGTSNFGGLATFNDIHTADLTSTTQMTVNFLQGVQGFFTHLQAGDILANTGNFNTLTVNSLATVNSATFPNEINTDGINAHNFNGQTISIIADGSIIANGGRMFSTGNNSPSYTMTNTIDGSSWCMANTSGNLVMGEADGSGNITNEIVTMNHSNDFIYNGTQLRPFTDNASSLGTNSFGWSTVYAHAYVTLSTDASSPIAGDGLLDLVKRVPVKTLPHIGLATEDIGELVGAVTGSGVNYNVVVGALWHALKELSVKFDAYVAAHP